MTKHNLRAKAHHLKPVVMFGAKGLTDAVIQEINIALTAHELIKVKLASQEKEERKNLLDEVCTKLEAECIQTIGNIAVLYRKNNN